MWIPACAGMTKAGGTPALPGRLDPRLPPAIAGVTGNDGAESTGMTNVAGAPAIPHQRNHQATACRSPAASAGHSARLKISVPFVPPNPNELVIATSIFISRAVWGT